MIPILKWIMPIHTVSEANSSEHWTKKKKRHDIQKILINDRFKRERSKKGGLNIPLPCKIKLTRVGKKLMDVGNVSMSVKWIQDYIADCIFPGLAPGVADGDPRLSWEYSQEVGKQYGVIVEFFSE